MAATVPAAPDEDEPTLRQGPVAWYKVYHASKGWLIYAGPPIPMLCPKGLSAG